MFKFRNWSDYRDQRRKSRRDFLGVATTEPKFCDPIVYARILVGKDLNLCNLLDYFLPN